MIGFRPLSHKPISMEFLHICSMHCGVREELHTVTFDPMLATFPQAGDNVSLVHFFKSIHYGMKYKFLPLFSMFPCQGLYQHPRRILDSLFLRHFLSSSGQRSRSHGHWVHPYYLHWTRSEQHRSPPSCSSVNDLPLSCQIWYQIIKEIVIFGHQQG